MGLLILAVLNVTYNVCCSPRLCFCLSCCRHSDKGFNIDVERPLRVKATNPSDLDTHLSVQTVDCVDRLSVSCSDTDSDSEDEAYYSGSSMESLPTSSSHLPSHVSSLSRVCWKKKGHNRAKSARHRSQPETRPVVPNLSSKGKTIFLQIYTCKHWTIGLLDKCFLLFYLFFVVTLIY